MDEQLEILFSRYLDGTASDEEVAALERHLEADPAAAGALFAAACEEEALRDALGRASGPSTPVPGPGGQWRVARSRLPGSRRTRSAGWAALAACLLIATAFGLRVIGSGGVRPDVPVVAGLDNRRAAPSPAVRVIPSGSGVYIERGRAGRHVPAATDAALGAADRVRTGAGGSAVIVPPGEDDRLSLGPDTELILSGDRQWELTAGTLQCKVAHRASGEPFIVTTPQADVRVVGTQFTLTLTRDWTRVEVSEGTVRVTRDSDRATVDVSGGQHVHVAGPHPAASPPWSTASRGQDMGAYWSVNLRPAGISE